MHYWLSIIVSSCLGILSGLGIGGGSLLMLWLTLYIKADYAEARLINLLFFIIPAIISCLACSRELYTHKSIIIPTAIAGVVSSLFFTFLSQSWETHFLRILFGVLLLILGIREIKAK